MQLVVLRQQESNKVGDINFPLPSFGIHEPYIETHSGIHFHFLEPSQDEIDIKDIAYALANQCRFNGHVPFFSVAEHSVAVAARLHPRLQLAGLLHDAAEAYLSDIPSPIKQFLPDYRAMEDRVQKVIYEKYNVYLSEAETAEIKKADRDATSTEAHYLLRSGGRDWNSLLFSPNEKYKPRLCPPPEAVQMFLHWAYELMEPENSLARQMGINV
jgi:hypothetical protein